MKFLHLLNGDTTLQQLNQTTIDGDRLVWREILCEGETTEPVGSPQFWEKRARFLSGFTTEGSLDVLEKLKAVFSTVKLSDFDEIVLWFEYDLFCQINLLGLLSWLNDRADAIQKVSLICLGEHPKYKGLVGLGEINSDDFYGLFDHRTPLHTEDLAYGAKIWSIYCSDNHEDLLRLIEPERNSVFPYLEEALRWHLKRLPDPGTGLDEIENEVLQLLATKPMDKRKLVGTLLRRDNFYGFGDLQYFKYIEQLSPVLEETRGLLKLNQLGEQIVAGEKNFRELRKAKRCYGGLEVA